MWILVTSYFAVFGAFRNGDLDFAVTRLDGANGDVVHADETYADLIGEIRSLDDAVTRLYGVIVRQDALIALIMIDQLSYQLAFLMSNAGNIHQSIDFADDNGAVFDVGRIDFDPLGRYEERIETFRTIDVALTKASIVVIRRLAADFPERLQCTAVVPIEFADCDTEFSEQHH